MRKSRDVCVSFYLCTTKTRLTEDVMCLNRLKNLQGKVLDAELVDSLRAPGGLRLLLAIMVAPGGFSLHI